MNTHSELDKLHTVKDKSLTVGEFLAWLGEQGVVLSHYCRGDLEPTYRSIEEWLALYFEIDLDQVDREKRAILARLRRSQP